MGKDKSIKTSLWLLAAAVLAVSGLVGAGIEWGKTRWQWTTHSPRTVVANSPSPVEAPMIAVSPKHKEILDQPPEIVRISFEFPVSQVKLSLRKGDEDLKGEPPEFSEDGKILSLPFPKKAGSGTYIVNYDLCPETADGGSVDGYFEFTVK